MFVIEPYGLSRGERVNELFCLDDIVTVVNGIFGQMWGFSFICLSTLKPYYYINVFKPWIKLTKTFKGFATNSHNETMAITAN